MPAISRLACVLRVRAPAAPSAAAAYSWRAQLPAMLLGSAQQGLLCAAPCRQFQQQAEAGARRRRLGSPGTAASTARGHHATRHRANYRSAAAVTAAAAAAASGLPTEGLADASSGAPAHGPPATDHIIPPQPTLDWKVGASLAGAAFEAYNELTERGVPVRIACGAEIYFTDREFLRDKLAGLLHLTVRRARSQPAEAASGPLSAAPQLQIAVGDSVWTSTAALNMNDPDWQEICVLYVRPSSRDSAHETLRVQVNESASDDSGSLGAIVQQLAPLCDGVRHDLTLPLLRPLSHDNEEESEEASKASSQESTSSGGRNGESGAVGSGEASKGGGSDGGREDGTGAAGLEGDSKGAALAVPDEAGVLAVAGESADLAVGAGRAEQCGSLQLSCRFFSFRDEPAQDAAADSEMGGPVLGSPGQIPLAADWLEVLELAGVAAHAKFQPIAFIENATTNTQAWVYRNKEERTICVAFRGTEQGKWRDIITDLHLVPAPLDPDRVAEAPRHAALAQVSAPREEPGQLTKLLSTVEAAKAEVAAQRKQQEEQQSCPEQSEHHILSTAVSAVKSTAEDLAAVLERVRAEVEAAGDREAEGADAGPKQAWVHSGFLVAYDSVRPAVLSLLSCLLEGEEEGWKLYLTGHSLGGALATLCAWDAAHRSWPCPLELSVYSFGAPRVGNSEFARHFNSLVPATWRFVNVTDSVATIPRLMGYAHVGHAVYLQDDGSAEVEMHTTERLGEGLGLHDLAPAVAAAAAAKVPELLPAVATEALKMVGLEVAAAGDEAAEAAAQASAASVDITASTASFDSAAASSPTTGDSASASASGGGGDGGGGAGTSDEEPPAVVGKDGTVAISPHHLPHLWEEEREAWASLLGGGALEGHMEPLYLANLRAYLARAVEAARSNGEGTPT